MNETQERAAEGKEEGKSEFENFQRGTYRRGARRRTKGNFTLFLVVALLAVIVITGIVFVIKTFMPVSTNIPANKNISEQNTEKNSSETVKNKEGFESVIDKYAVLSKETILKNSDGDEFVLEKGILNYCQSDLDSDGKNELFMITADNNLLPELSVYENDDGQVRRNAYYVYAGNLLEKDENSKSEIYILKNSDKVYLYIEKYCFDSADWTLEILSYSDGFELIEKYDNSDLGNASLKEYGLMYSGSDYSEATALKMNGDIEDAALLLSFEVKEKELITNIY